MRWCWTSCVMTRPTVSGTKGTSINSFFGRIAALGGARNPHGFLGSEPKLAEPLARPQGAMRRIAAKLESDPNAVHLSKFGLSLGIIIPVKGAAHGRQSSNLAIWRSPC